MKSQTLSWTDIKIQSLATLVAVVCAVALPQIFHAVGTLAGVGTDLGAAWLPMHLPVLMVGLLAGPIAGLATGLIAPALSYGMTGMPMLNLLPYMMIELAAYGLIMGLLSRNKMPVMAKLVIAMIGGRVVRAVAILISVNILGSATISTGIIFSSIVTGIPGIVLQLILVPLFMYLIEKRAAND